MAHQRTSDLTSSGQVGEENTDTQATRLPTNQGERELMLDRQSLLSALGRRRLLEQAQLPLMTLADGEESLQGGHRLVQARP